MRVIRKVIFSVCLLLHICLAVQAQEPPEEEIMGVLIPLQHEEARNRLLLSKSRSNYPVTPGDVYEISYRLAEQEITREVVVESDYNVNLSVFGQVDASGMTFPEFKDKVEEIITTAYPASVPFVDIVSVGVFQVLLTGEVPQAQFVTAWGMTRLSEIIEGRYSEHSSVRRIGIISGDGQLRHYDLYRASREGQVEEDPFVKPGDTVTMYFRGREVEIRGEVRRPGRYQLLEREGLLDVIERYSRGLTNLANSSRIKVEGRGRESSRMFFFDMTSQSRGEIPLVEDGDRITVPSKLASLPVVIFEGALGIPGEEPAVEGVEISPGGEYARISYTFMPGETVYDALSSADIRFSSSADLENAYLIRDASGERLPLDLQKLTHSPMADNNVTIEPFDRIVVPSRRYFVSVVGEVDNPGNIGYVPDRMYDYYVGIAGGMPSGTLDENIVILDGNGIRKSPHEEILPEDTIVVAASYVSVTGAVLNPGRYLFTPSRKYTYFVDVAGGIDTERNSLGRVQVVDEEGNVRDLDETIQPRDRIYLASNNFVYNFNRYFPVVTTGIAFITTIITIIDLLND